MKSYTDIEQSKVLSNILPIESADMFYHLGESQLPNVIYGNHNDFKGYLFCWSLAALLDSLKIFTTPTAFSVEVCVPLLRKTNNGYSLTYTGDYTLMDKNNLDKESPIEVVADNPIDVYYEMIIRLHELNLL